MDQRYTSVFLVILFCLQTVHLYQMVTTNTDFAVTCDTNLRHVGLDRLSYHLKFKL